MIIVVFKHYQLDWPENKGVSEMRLSYMNLHSKKPGPSSWIMATVHIIIWIIVIIVVDRISVTDQQLFRPGQEPQNVINSLLTPILPRSECVAAVDNRMGLCMPKSACLSSGGYVAGTCGYVLSCCVYQGTCRAVVTSNETYFVSPNYPNLLTGKVDPPIRIDFDEFSLAPHYNGNCGLGVTDSFLVSGAANFNSSGLPTTGICGEMTGQHIYLDVDPDKTDDPLLLIINTANQQEYNRKWSIRIRQIPCKSKYRAPPGCLQYFTSLTGNIESFNYRTTNLPLLSPVPGEPPTLSLIPANYFNKLNYGVCIGRQPKMCAIKYSAIEFQLGGYNGVADASSKVDQQCSPNGDGDYVLIPLGTDQTKQQFHDRFCGKVLAPVQGQTTNAEVYSFITPYVMYFHTDSVQNEFETNNNLKGFLLKYQQVPC